MVKIWIGFFTADYILFKLGDNPYAILQCSPVLLQNIYSIISERKKFSWILIHICTFSFCSCSKKWVTQIALIFWISASFVDYFWYCLQFSLCFNEEHLILNIILNLFKLLAIFTYSGPRKILSIKLFWNSRKFFHGITHTFNRQFMIIPCVTLLCFFYSGMTIINGNHRHIQTINGLSNMIAYFRSISNSDHQISAFNKH